MTEEQRKVLAKSRRPALRIHVPKEIISFQDGLLGPCLEDVSTECGDFILRRSDGVFAYQLACACDDGAMGVTQVVRGEIFSLSTPQQIYLLRLLEYPVEPQYYHIPLLLSPVGIRLSKRDKTFSGSGRAAPAVFSSAADRPSGFSLRPSATAGACISPGIAFRF